MLNHLGTLRDVLEAPGLTVSPIFCTKIFVYVRVCVNSGRKKSYYADTLNGQMFCTQ